MVNGILLEKFKSVYIYIPKNASSSLLTNFADSLNIAHEKVHEANFQWINEKEIKSKYPDYFKFCFVRNPWDRLVSLYESKINNRDVSKYVLGKKYGDLFHRNMGFEEFIKTLFNIPKENIDPHFASQLSLISDAEGRVLVDFIGRFENLNSDFTYISDKIGIKSKLCHVNKTNRKRYRRYYSKEIKESISKRYEDDIGFFGYSFSGFSPFKYIKNYMMGNKNE